jgi:hypothetical protein
MRIIAVAVVTALAVVPTAVAEEVRTLSDTVPAAGLERLVLESGVGDVEVVATTGDRVSFEVRLEARRGGFFSSKKRAEREVDEATLNVEVVGSTLTLAVDSDADERRFEETWRLEIPARLAFELDLGVGDVTVRGVAGDLSIESGVGDVVVDGATGGVDVELGVGNVVVTAPLAGAGRVECSAGVGDASIRAGGDVVTGDGFVGHECDYAGRGEHEITVEVGVGDARVRLE